MRSRDTRSAHLPNVSRSQEAGAAAEEISARQAAVDGSGAHHGDELVPRQ
ncbi:MAG: hypothetical protein ACRERE_14245 [Candidatus Entotheonellia bacterium]